ncbi:hypothetical protein [Gloeocapsopsis dulcis]|uniref:Uncharacterized protein n=1 Tax=Gloeocapsopsis dulcis AAB1 = 1H9 TaxID=1433147 RepID=A0A6N8FU98_9CHRO|nr:hypothetical protein [Gloeocapsopsis dulcis]MUL36521.1 hypothetical protein [Gloeocapsopsis dulcis AAB1 = 1H9]WNN87806.1 hypothetical protein P0S91_15985 [Gloeocapsopsis dulcis]
MFLMRLEINRLGWQQESVIENQWESEDEIDREYETKFEEVEDVIEILFVLCKELEESNLVRFRVEGFGKMPWPVDVRTDFEIVLEQLPDLIKFLDTTEAITGYLDFYEQGIERRLVFNKVGDLVKINCQPFPVINKPSDEPGDSWGQDIQEEPIDITHLKQMICDLIRSFVLIANELCPIWTSHELFQEWCSDKYIADCLQR